MLTEPGVYEEGVLEQGDAGYAPSGSAHWLRNASNDTEAFVVLMFDDGLFTNIDLPWFIGNTDPEVIIPSPHQDSAMCEFLSNMGKTSPLAVWPGV